MLTTLIIAILVCVLLITIILTNPSLRLGPHHFTIRYYYAPLLGAILLLLTGRLSLLQVWEGLTGSGSINPLKILVLFISMTTLSIFLDEAGMFRLLAGIALNHAKTSQYKLFCYLYLMVAVLTVFTSNDIIILTFTPFICYFSKNAKIDPMPYLFGEFVAANTWSMMLVIGNPTNIYLATAEGITFGDYTAVMALPTVFAGAVAFVLLFFMFRKQLAMPLSPSPENYNVPDKKLVLIGVLHLGLCTVLLVISSYTGMEMWLITLCFALSLFTCVTIYQKLDKKKRRGKLPAPHTSHILLHTLRRAPWELIPFVISMFLLVLSLEKYGITSSIASILGESVALWKYGVASFFSANLINNIPMAVAFSAITRQLSEGTREGAVYASIIGSNLGAFFTPLGALAGIMWSGILGKMNVRLSFPRFISYGARISLPTLLAALAGLALRLG